MVLPASLHHHLRESRKLLSLPISIFLQPVSNRREAILLLDFLSSHSILIVLGFDSLDTSFFLCFFTPRLSFFLDVLWFLVPVLSKQQWHKP